MMASALLLPSCAADPEKARYIGNDRIIGNYTETQVGQAVRGTVGVAALVGLEIFSGGEIDLFDFFGCD
jgi:hypothetical protein